MKKVLIAEDEKDIRELVGFTLKLAGFEVVFSANGREAVNIAKVDQPDLVLMDLHMPVMDGERAAQMLAEDPMTQNIPVIFMTARDQDAEICGRIGQGVDYIAKPFAIDSLTKKVMAVLAENGKE
jgi:CheY-like chemotaxis protein